MDFIDNLLNHMSSKFNQESTLPKQSEISMDETFKWRALKNNQFASRSKSSRSKIKSKDKVKQDVPDSEMSMSSYENKTSEHFEYPTVADVSENTDIEIEIANDISGAEIQEVLAASQGNISEMLNESSEPHEESVLGPNETIKPTNNIEVVDPLTCTSNIESTDNEAAEVLGHNENPVTPVQGDLIVEKSQADESKIEETFVEPSASDNSNDRKNNSYAENIFIHMSSTFNGPGSNENPSTENLINEETQKSIIEKISSTESRAPGSKSIAREDNEDIPATTFVRRSKRLKQDHLVDADSSELELLANQETEKSKSPTKAVDEQISSSDDVKMLDNTVRTLRNKSFEIKWDDTDARVKSNTKKKHKTEPKMQESQRIVDIVKKQNPVSADLKKNTRSKTILRKIPVKRRTQYLRSSYPTRQRNSKLDKKSEIRKSRFWNTKTKTKKSEQGTGDPKTKCSPETQMEATKVKNPKERSPKRSIRLSRDGSDGILASAIARREKIDTNGFQGRLSRPIKLSAKILANDELRYGFELQNNARLNLQVEVKDTSNVNESVHSVADSDIKKLEMSEEKIPIITEKPSCDQIDCFPCEKTLSNVQIKCPDPLEFLNDIKRNKFGSNKSPECNDKLTKMQQKKMYKLKEKHFFMLGLKKITKNKLLAKSEKSTETINVNKEDRKVLRNTSNEVIDTTTSDMADTGYSNESIQPETSLELPTTHLQSKFLCFCQKDTRYFTTKSKSRMYCTATDDINGKLVGCCNELKGGLQNLLRPSSSASYQLLCLTHQRRLHHHGSCATCGVFCTQGYFVICSNKHLFHKECADKFIINTKEKSSPIIPKLVLKCPHCGLENVIREYKVRLQKSLSFAIVTKRP